MAVDSRPELSYHVLMNRWYKVWLPLGNFSETNWTTREVCVQAECSDEAEEIAVRCFIPRGWGLDDAPNITLFTDEEHDAWVRQRKEWETEKAKK